MTLLEQIRQLYQEHGTDAIVQAIAAYRKEVEAEKERLKLEQQLEEITEKLDELNKTHTEE